MEERKGNRESMEVGMVNEGIVIKREASRRGWTIREDASKGRRANVGGRMSLEVRREKQKLNSGRKEREED